MPAHSTTRDYLTNWHNKLYDLEWLPWSGTFFQGIRPRPTQGYIQFFHNPNDAPQVEAHFRSIHDVRITMGEESESVQEMMDRYIAVIKAEYNMYWSMRVVYEQAGWPDGFVKERFRRGVDEWEEGWRQVTAENGKDVGKMVEGKALREWYHKNARNHAV
ncbi:hypothetical protein Slin15195_G065240 [Septoria linicola]|uniref:Uncharacterized protein n=1 Tax=Septoria linicola TaxID=215465 RepID=A0A9Q9EJN3_9PEZI|nr:hypothetical protein Slin14017_G115580 [Septoria linicola]USW53205.1 hypothetical protein Slin15195_G065240 [Septoria linicola]